MEAAAKRRLGLGFTGLGDALIMLGLRYDTQQARDVAAKIACMMRDAAYSASVELAQERGPFDLFDAGALSALDENDPAPVLNALFAPHEPKTGTDGTLAWAADVSNPSTHDDFVLMVKELQMPDGCRRPYSLWLTGALRVMQAGRMNLDVSNLKMPPLCEHVQVVHPFNPITTES